MDLELRHTEVSSSFPVGVLASESVNDDMSDWKLRKLNFQDQQEYSIKLVGRFLQKILSSCIMGNGPVCLL